MSEENIPKKDVFPVDEVSPFPLTCVYPWLLMSWKICVKTAKLFWQYVKHDGSERFLVGPLAGVPATDITDMIDISGDNIEGALSEESGYLMVCGLFPLTTGSYVFTVYCEITLYNQVPAIHVTVHGGIGAVSASDSRGFILDITNAFDEFMFKCVYAAPYKAESLPEVIKWAQEKREWVNRNGAIPPDPGLADTVISTLNHKDKQKMGNRINPFVAAGVIVGVLLLAYGLILAIHYWK